MLNLNKQISVSILCFVGPRCGITGFAQTPMALAPLVLAVDVRKLIAKHVVDGRRLARKLLLGKLKNQVNASNFKKSYAVHNYKTCPCEYDVLS